VTRRVRRCIIFAWYPIRPGAHDTSGAGGQFSWRKSGRQSQGRKNWWAHSISSVCACDLETLASLPSASYRAGLAEVIKYGIIYDANLFKNLERNLHKLLRREPIALAFIVCAMLRNQGQGGSPGRARRRLRQSLISGIPSDTPLRPFSGYGKFLHGEASRSVKSRLPDSLLKCSVDKVRRAAHHGIVRRAGLPTRAKLNVPDKRNSLWR